MDTRFVLPVTTAAALHAFLFWGIGTDGKPPHRTPAKSTAVVCKLVEFVLPPEPPPEETDPASSAPKGSPDAEVPTLPDELTSTRSIFEMPPVPNYPPPKNPVDRISFEPPGNPDGILDNYTHLPPINSGALDNPPRTRSQTPPAYPAEARRNGLPGEVLVDFIVDESGRVKTAHVVNSTDRQFEEPTLRAVYLWRFQPGKKNGRPVSFRMVAPVVFSLND
jgi:protein TonB